MCGVSCVRGFPSTLSQRRRLEVAAARETKTETARKGKASEGKTVWGRENEESGEEGGERGSERVRERERKKKRKSVELIRVRDNAVAE